MISCDQIEIGRLPSAIRTDNGMNISFTDIESHLVDSPKFSKIFCYSFESEETYPKSV